ncbi:MAG: alpha-L-fucosidase [Arachidicoccus sp.]|nr:alpha-L-fucosidase [Arachidicoccus sp.]
MKKIVILLLYILNSSIFLYAQYSNYCNIDSTDSEENIINKSSLIVPTPRQLRWQQLELTAFFHFGINTFTNNEWGSGKEDIRIFNPISFDAKQWVRIVKQAGFKQVILTAKHHDGFCLWPSKYTKHTVEYTPWQNGKGDIVKEVSKACKYYGIGFGIYLSPWDRNSVYYGDSVKYNRYFINQLTELLSNYGKIDEVWFDGANGEGPNGKKQVYAFEDWYKLIRKLQPEAVIAVMGPDVRWVGTETGQGRNTEWSVLPISLETQNDIAKNSQKNLTFLPHGNMMDDDLGSRDKLREAKGLIWYPSETDVSIRPGWFYHSTEDTKVKTVKELKDIYYSSVGRNSVLLLNIPPNKQGLISNADSAALIKWSLCMKEIFSKNLLNESVVSSVVNDVKNSHYNIDTSATIYYKNLSLIKCNLIQLQEDITKGQRIEKFNAEYEKNGVWVPFAEGTTIGYKRILSFPAIVTKSIRINIIASRATPYLNGVELYYDEAAQNNKSNSTQ